MLKYVIVIFLGLLLSCNEKVVEKPENLIPEDKMATILYDVALLNAGKIINESTLNEYDIQPMAYIYNKYGIDSVQFVKSDTYYASIPTEYEAIYTKVKDRLERDEKFFEEKRQQKQDSIKEAKEKLNPNTKKKPVGSKDSLP
ncbi:DUF4296 domain-containing protein [Arenibacter sp. M-2]|uniref:DUF4296 domain-containing protein n=1 Tax=Arenibacter sp. M-2 TaxID=3053612 RepID=UPI00257061DF|nr:DUF4296 domain-containing protein [Arenibacter sp. M-2]MDL5510959.1 DUF4296 domain-containing protein [Arenibacter sp. M-2]|tara:strand:+ start:3156 stop:3584 length:429 start_codon:yes stop_codon:yes gene_type:complete